MIRAVRALAPSVLLLPALLFAAACGSEKADAGTAPADGPGAATAAELTARARALGVDPELVYVTTAPGFTLARQSVGVHGADGFSATYVSAQGGRQLRLSVDRAGHSGAGCGEPTVVCVDKGDHVVRVAGDGVPEDVLREAAKSVHRPSGEEIAELLPPAHAAPDTPAGPSTPAERGDLPPVGDGAPNNDVGAGG
ncbi:hypothetical protein ACFYOV_09355 [Streptomyces sp. NPDC005931]|uniref:hypothetical protein n=1 Tax=Streptomyces sp. NPDC005931 TaxID=3364737 RepID=UPI0036A04D3C